MTTLTEEQLEEVWKKVRESTASMRRQDIEWEENIPELMEELKGDGYLHEQKKRRARRQMMEDAPPANRPDLIQMQRVTDDVIQARREERVNAAADAARELARNADGFVSFKRVQEKKFSDMLPEGFKYRRDEKVPIGATVIDKTAPETAPETTPETTKKPWWRSRGGGGTAVSNVALAAVVVVSAIVGSFQA